MTRTKRCGTCREIKPLEQFYNSANTIDGKGYRCKPCDREARNSWTRNNPERSQRSSRSRNLLFKYGLTLEEFEQRLVSQEGRCLICQETLQPGRGTAVDHCHTDGRVRGLLCVSCNGGLGMFKDNKTNLARAIQYLETH